MFFKIVGVDNATELNELIEELEKKGFRLESIHSESRIGKISAASFLTKNSCWSEMEKKFKKGSNIVGIFIWLPFYFFSSMSMN